MLTPRDFPVLRPVGTFHRPKHRCTVCGLGVEPRNGRAHAKACSRRKQQDPALWLLWKLEMSDVPDVRIRQHLRGVYAQQLVNRGLLPQGPLQRGGRL